MSDDTARRIDAEVRQIIDTAHQRAKDLLIENRDKLDMMAESLMRYETIDTAQIDDIMDGREPGPPEHWSESQAKADDKDDGGSAAPETTGDGDRDDPSPIGGPAGQT